MSDFCIQRFVFPETIINKELWRYLPAINVDKVADIPVNYPGVMGVPLTFLNKYDPDRFELIDAPVNMPKLETGRKPYKRVMVRNLHPILPPIMILTISGLGEKGLCPVCGERLGDIDE